MALEQWARAKLCGVDHKAPRKSTYIRQGDHHVGELTYILVLHVFTIFARLSGGCRASASWRQTLSRSLTSDVSSTGDFSWSSSPQLSTVQHSARSIVKRSTIEAKFQTARSLKVIGIGAIPHVISYYSSVAIMSLSCTVPEIISGIPQS